ncbi:Nsp2 [Mobuck virus]|uniref:Nsp2 n=1 Tax=Mobuck virus TaxID=1408137 RepID=UPI0003BA0038|nr:Nsp2 [Mobuck virus]AGX89728.1 Nsp2 [Mobuck virus]
MESQRQPRAQSGDRVTRTPIRTFILYSTTEDNFVGRICKTLHTQYLAVKLGVSTHIEGVNTPVPRSTVVTITGPCAFKVVDRETTCHFMISATGIETRIGRWAQYKFETVETRSRFCKMEIGGQSVDEMLRLGRATGSVLPYTEEEMMGGDEDVDLPGVKIVSVENEDVPNLREKMKMERQTKRDLIGMALKESGATRGEGRLYGARPETMAKLQSVKKLTTRIQGKQEKLDRSLKSDEACLDLKPKMQRPSRISSFSPVTKDSSVIADEEAAEASPATIAKLMRQHSITDQAPIAKMITDEVSIIETASLADKLRKSAQSTPLHFSPIMSGGFSDLDISTQKIKVQEIPASPQLAQAVFKLNEEYKTLSAIVHQDERLPPELSMLELGTPVKMGAFERVATTYNFSSGGMLPVFNVNTSSNEYKFVGFERVSRAVVVISAGAILVLPVY